MSKLLPGIDVGTYSSKGVLVGANGAVVKTAVVENDTSIPQLGHPLPRPHAFHPADCAGKYPLRPAGTMSTRPFGEVKKNVKTTRNEPDFGIFRC
jgi:hypothetical protein